MLYYLQKWLKPLIFQDQLVKVLNIKVCAQQRFAKIKETRREGF